jgi:glutathione S-transferase
MTKAGASRLGDAAWLDGEFSAGDLMMVSVLLRLRSIPTRRDDFKAHCAHLWLALCKDKSGGVL